MSESLHHHDHFIFTFQQTCSRTMSRNLVFVYGTLKQKEPNHNWLTNKDHGKSHFIGSATSVEKNLLVIASRYNIPYVLDAAGKGEHIQGEVYEVDDKMLANLDILESHPKYYERKMTKIRMDDSKEEVDCWMYILFGFKPYMMDLPFLKAYYSEGDHGKKYVSHYLREVTGPEYWNDVKVDFLHLGDHEQ
ncbi:putative gamma-glutamylcyclotransferase CG2811 isoform X2 [Panulirus ornatus]|uniref:putative gamma-glutamylcyclotransferase CG2811 isoform X2 n=1 Tax=Panulirus ornatus TaxID=150431 RepID=UPI003A883F70